MYPSSREDWRDAGRGELLRGLLDVRLLCETLLQIVCVKLRECKVYIQG